MSKKSKKAKKASKSPEVPLRSLDASEVVINFLVNAPLGMALGMDKQAPGLMSLRPRSRDANIAGLQIQVWTGGSVHGRLHAGADQLRHQPLRQPGHRLFDGSDGLLT